MPAVPPSPPLAGLAEIADAIGSFFSSFAHVRPLPLAVGLVCFLLYLTIRSRAYFHTLRAAYPTERFQWRRIWGAYIAAYGFNNVIPARGGDVIKVFLVKTSVPRSTYPAITASMFVEAVFDASIAIPILLFAFTQGVFPKPPDFANLGAFDLSFVFANPHVTLFVLTAVAIALLVAFAVLSERARRFWARVRQGVAILTDRRRFLREVWLVLFAAYLVRLAAFWALLEAFHVGGSVRNVLLVHGINAVASLMPFTPGGAGVQQAFMVKVFAGSATGATVAAYSVGQQIVIAVACLAVGFVALVRIFGFRSFKEVIAAGKEHRSAEATGEAGREPAA
ncbi:lysylphosphatidylglycerol synthase transmembrane domain-containing protein [Patulibacter sp. S7RM1-6]